MVSLAAPSAGVAQRARRWDAIVLGSSLPALVAAARLGAAGHRVLVVEEEAVARAHPALREPFLLGDGARGGVLDACLRELGVPLIDRRRLEHADLACQVVTPERRVDVGEADLTAEEWVAWGLAKPEAAVEGAHGLRAAARAAATALLEAPLVRLGRRAVAPRAPAAPVPAASAPASVPEAVGAAAGDGAAAAGGPLESHLAALARALSNRATAELPPSSRARLVGSVLGGGSRFAGGPPWLHELLRRRVEALYGEFRALSGEFRLVAAGGDPGIEVALTRDLWLARALVVGVSRAALAPHLGRGAVDGDLGEAPRPAGVRLRLHFEVDRDALPEGMADRVVLVSDEAAPPVGTSCIALARFPGTRQRADLVASAVLAPDADRAAAAAEIEERLRALMPFAGPSLVRHPVARPAWDDDDVLCDPPAGTAWPPEVDLRLSSRPRIYALERAGVAELGLEGDLLLGWRGGDAVAAELG